MSGLVGVPGLETWDLLLALAALALNGALGWWWADQVAALIVAAVAAVQVKRCGYRVPAGHAIGPCSGR